MHFNIKHGFTLMEVLLTIAMLAIVVTPLMFQQSTIMRNVNAVSRRVERLITAQTFLYEARASMQEHATSFSLQKKMATDDVTLKFARTAVDKKSAFARAPHLYKDEVRMEWQEDGMQRNDTLITFSYVQPQEAVS